MSEGILTEEELAVLPKWAQRQYLRAIENEEEKIVYHYYWLAREIKESRRLRDDGS